MTQRTTRIPTPVYAIAGVGEIAYRQLRELREEFPNRVAELPNQIRLDVPATMNSLVAGAGKVYDRLVARGERVVGRRRTVTASLSTHTAPPPAKKATKTTKATKAPATQAPATKTAAKATKATKKATPTKRTAAK